MTPAALLAHTPHNTGCNGFIQPKKAGWSVPLNDYDAIMKTNPEYDSITSFVVIKCKPVKVVQTT